MPADRKIEPKLAEAAAKTTAVLETLRSRLSREVILPETSVIDAPEGSDELSRQLEQYFAAETSVPSRAVRPVAVNGSGAQIPDEIRAQVIDGVVDRILRSWGSPAGEIPASIKSEVIARLVEYVLRDLLKRSASPR